jgi:hypothetical protein
MYVPLGLRQGCMNVYVKTSESPSMHLLLEAPRDSDISNAMQKLKGRITELTYFKHIPWDNQGAMVSKLRQMVERARPQERDATFGPPTGVSYEPPRQNQRMALINDRLYPWDGHEHHRVLRLAQDPRMRQAPTRQFNARLDRLGIRPI